MACPYNKYNVSLFDKLINHQYNGKTLNWLLLQPWWWFFICFSWWWYLTLNSLSPGCFPSENVKLFRGNEILKDPERSVLKFLKSGSKVESWTPLNRSAGQLWDSRQKSFYIENLKRIFLVVIVVIIIMLIIMIKITFKANIFCCPQLWLFLIGFLPPVKEELCVLRFAASLICFAN